MAKESFASKMIKDTNSDSEIFGNVFLAAGDGIDNGLRAAKGKLGMAGGGFTRVGAVDVVKDFRWSVKHGQQDFIKDVPCIKLKEFQPEDAPFLEDISYAFKTAAQYSEYVADTATSPYAKMYNGIWTGNTYTLPFFSEYNHNLQNEWSIADGINAPSKKIMSKLGKLAGLLERGSAEQRWLYSGTTKAQFSFDFTLFNTIDERDIGQNMLFIRALLANNMINRTSALTYRSPCFYTVEIPGVRYSPAAYITAINIHNLGQVNKREVDGNMTNIPDAWKVEIAIQEMMVESKQIFNGAFDASKKVRVISDDM